MGAAMTEGTLRDWRYGQVQAERLTGAVLHLEGYEDVDPQHPLGGPDGLKDALCRREGLLWVAAAYFPQTPVSFRDIQNKFNDDAVGVIKNNANGFLFFVNQRLTVGERSTLIGDLAIQNVEIYHLERLISVLNSPKGCGARLEFLRIPMTEAEQWSFWSTMNADIVRRLASNEARRGAEINNIDQKLELILKRTLAIEFNLNKTQSSLASRPAVEAIEFPTASLSMSTLCWLHRLLTENSDLSEAVRGRFRAVNVWIGEGEPSQSPHDYVPPPFTEVVARTKALLEWWRDLHPTLIKAEKTRVARQLANFHHQFLQVHPFLDTNGRVARIVLDQSARELLNQSVGPGFVSQPADYYAALKQADAGDLGPLTSRVLAALQ